MGLGLEGLKKMNIPKSVYDEMIEYAKKTYPQEACGFVVGKKQEASYFMAIENMDHSSVTYTMDPKAQMKAFKKMSEDGLDLIGIFHSHVASEAVPSQTDKKMAFYPDVSYLIVSLADMAHPDLKSYQIADEQVKLEEIKII